MTDGAVLQVSLRWEVVYCCKCGIGFAVGADIRGNWVEKGTGFYCPNGHLQSYCESEVVKLNKQLAAERKRKEWAEQDARNQMERRQTVERRLKAQRAATTRMKRRVGHGVCPCCTRTFTNLQRHMAAQHPTFGGQKPAEIIDKPVK